MAPRSWKDQPKILEGAKVKTSFRLSGIRVEIREASDGTYYVTVGTLFASQTLWVPDAAKVLDAIGYIKKAAEEAYLQDEHSLPAKQVPPPEGTRLMEAD